MTDQFSIAQVEQATGIPKDLLRMWERRYGFPQPARDAQGDRVYVNAEIRKLDLMRRLMEQGKRPGKLVGMSVEALQQLYSQGMAKEADRLNELIPTLKGADFHAVREWLDTRLHSQGLRRFVCETLPQLNQIVGNAWEDGTLGVHEEHLYTEQVNNQLRTAIAALPAAPATSARALLTTTPGEQHGLGLLMVEAILRQEGFIVISLGTETPLEDIARAATTHQTEVVALSFSTAFVREQAHQCLLKLRDLLPPTLHLWAGGAAVHEEAPMQGVIIMRSLDDVITAARALNQSRPLPATR